jgi:hypothetical protein
MSRKLGDSITFTGGAEVSPKVEVTRFYSPNSMNHMEKTLHIQQGHAAIQVSPATLKAILEWWENKS